MRLATPSLAILSARSEKETKLREFLAQALTESAPASFITLVIRSFDSPVARALQATLSSCQASDSTAVRVIVLDANADLGNEPTLRDVSGVDCRALRDPRFCDAHEQLVVSPAFCWVGDCMRRDPAKRDAFEIYFFGADAGRTHLAASFAKLWSAAAPLLPLPTAEIDPGVIAAEQATTEIPASGDNHR